MLRCPSSAVSSFRFFPRLLWPQGQQGHCLCSPIAVSQMLFSSEHRGDTCWRATGTVGVSSLLSAPVAPHAAHLIRGSAAIAVNGLLHIASARRKGTRVSSTACCASACTRVRPSQQACTPDCLGIGCLVPIATLASTQMPTMPSPSSRLSPAVHPRPPPPPPAPAHLSIPTEPSPRSHQYPRVALLSSTLSGVLFLQLCFAESSLNSEGCA